jgi:hypothetical protein
MGFIKKFLNGDEKLGFAFFIYGIVGYFLFRLLLTTPAFFVINAQTKWNYNYLIVAIKSISMAVCILIYYGLWKCAKNSDLLPRILVLSIYTVIVLFVVFVDYNTISAML